MVAMGNALAGSPRTDPDSWPRCGSGAHRG